MKVAIVSWHFPPYNTIAAVRVGKFARFLHQSGCDVRIITPGNGDADQSQVVEIPEEKILRTGWIDIDKYVHPLTSRRQAASDGQPNVASTAPVPTRRFRIREELAAAYNSIFFFPDRYCGWYPAATKAASKLFREWRPDIIVASGPPFTAFLIASRLSKTHGVPWIAEFRDRWTDDPYRTLPSWRNRIEACLERKTLGTASGVVTVSRPWETFYREKFSLPVRLVMNGYDPVQIGAPTPPREAKGTPLNIVHMGSIYPGKRDPSPLFEAIARANLPPGKVKVVFYGNKIEHMIPLAEKYGVRENLELLGQVDYATSLAIQKTSDILLLLQWNNPREQGNVPAKLFEYLAVQRPILGIGLDEGVPARIIRERQAGLFSNDPEEISRQLQAWIGEKSSSGCIAQLPASANEGLTRDQQFSSALPYMKDIAGASERRTATAAASDSHALAAWENASFHEVDENLLEKPTLCIVVDTEEEFDWDGPFSRTGHSVESVKSQHLAQNIFAKNDAPATYLIDYPVLDDPDSIRILKEFNQNYGCELGVQLHPWVTPPHREDVNEENSFICNLPLELVREKIEITSEKFHKEFGFFPKTFKAGRYGINLEIMRMIQELGYEIDTSIVPYTSFQNQKGPSFATFTEKPFWLNGNRDFLEIPISRGYSGALRTSRINAEVSKVIDSGNAAIRKIPGLFSKSGLLERVTLTPEGITHADHRRLIRNFLNDGRRLFCFSYHSTSLLPGCTPYVQTAEDLPVFLERIERFIEFFKYELGGEVMTPSQVFSLLRKKAA